VVLHFQFRSFSAKVSNLVVNASTLVIPMIEAFEALELVDEIAAHYRVDSLLIGTNDLTAEMGIPGAHEKSRVTESYQCTINSCQKVCKWFC
jgi:2-keto-3-deoxy-L-rhamnonate aldolase RhmA